MTPLSLGTGSHGVPRDFPALMELLGSRPQPAVVWYGPSEERVELSGRVLQNWAIKLVGLFREEAELELGDHVLVDVAPHWKACAVVLAASSLGCRVTLGRTREVKAEEVRLVVTDRPQAWEASEALGDAELAALSPGLLDDSYADALGEDIPGWVLDVSAEVRQHPDQLLDPLPQVALPAHEGASTAGSESMARCDVICADEEGLAVILDSAQRWKAWRAQAWDPQAPAVILHAWAGSGTVVVVDAGTLGGQDEIWDRVLRNEGVD
ncbi:TIGR03089 family protein [Nesterenkonia sp. HG001]|uniref:TIGR03089 family protein n=1 Tax=Nesterenkonia sp. HG001 TaxID=2983207 RepID=UPI002AC73B08|nr:TIGR03089 family protein [Nesterenkonia sp. HG001]MDZ5076958.1 TIGR03089 family protein [Nesterenkonia sp. HG001]